MTRRFQVPYSTAEKVSMQGTCLIVISAEFPVINPNAPGRSSLLNKRNVRIPLGGSEALAEATVN